MRTIPLRGDIQLRMVVVGLRNVTGCEVEILSQSLHSSMRRLKESKQTLSKNKCKEKLEQMQSTPYTFLVPNNNLHCKCMQNMQKQLDSVENQTRQLKCKLSTSN